MKKSILLFTLCVTLSLQAATLRLQHPQQTWRYGKGTIKDVSLSVRPLGLYMEYGLYLTFADQSGKFNNSDSVEVQYFFNLPQDAIVHDLWLWVGSDIMRGLIMDRWHASAIYENIVKRRRDPALLFKNSANQYELRVYPLAGKGCRRLKLTWLTRCDWSATTVSAPLPLDLFAPSQIPLDKLTLYFWPNEQFTNPYISELPTLGFKTNSDSSGQVYKAAVISGSALNQPLHLCTPAPLQNGVFFQCLDKGSEGFYQLALLPQQLFANAQSRNMLFLCDYDAKNGDLSGEQMMIQLKTILKQSLAPTDSFNLFASQLLVKRACKNWLPATPANIDWAFANLGNRYLGGYSMIPSLLAEGIDFVSQNGQDAQIVLISNGDKEGDYRVANSLISDVKARMNPLFPIHVADYARTGMQNYYFNSRNFAGNEYFFINLTQQTNGQFRTMRSTGTFFDTIAPLLTGVRSEHILFDMHLSLANGICHNRYDAGTSDGDYYLDSPILQIGRFNGSAPFNLDASVVVNGTVLSKKLTLQGAPFAISDSLMEEMWSGRHIAELEQRASNNWDINQIITESLQQRILSRYTAFLALEPSDQIKACRGCVDESVLDTRVDDYRQPVEMDSLFQAYPNPFNARTIIKIRLGKHQQQGDLEVGVYNLLGQRVRHYQPEKTEFSRDFTFRWDGRDDNGQTMATGTYLIIAKTAAWQQTLKVTMVK